MADEVIPIGRLSAQTGVSVEAIRYYERIGLLVRPRRNDGGRRQYGPSDFRTLSFVRRARDLGFKIEDIRSMLSLGAPADGTCKEVRPIAARHLDELRSKLRDLQKLEQTLAAAVDRCPGGDSPGCPVLDILDAERTASPPRQ